MGRTTCAPGFAIDCFGRGVRTGVHFLLPLNGGSERTPPGSNVFPVAACVHARSGRMVGDPVAWTSVSALSRGANVQAGGATSFQLMVRFRVDQRSCAAL